MLMDFYELTMANGYFVKGCGNTQVVFDMFYRENPENGGFVVCAGLEQLVEYIQEMHFTQADIDYLRGRAMFDEGFLEYLKNFAFKGTIEAVAEGTIVYPGTPLVTVTAPLIDAQLVETMLLLTICLLYTAQRCERGEVVRKKKRRNMGKDRWKNRRGPVWGLLGLLIFLTAGGYTAGHYGQSGTWPWQKEQAAAPLAGNAVTAVEVLDVGQASSMLIVCDGKAVLIDTGDTDSGSTVLSALKKYGISRLDLLILTHAHADHIGGASAVLAQVPAEQMFKKRREILKKDYIWAAVYVAGIGQYGNYPYDYLHDVEICQSFAC